jgi:L-lactate utilization protein LutC
MNKYKNIEQGQQRVEALQHEAARLADQARDQLADYADKFDRSRQGKLAKLAFRNKRTQIQQAAADTSDQVAAAMASALEEAAGRLRTYTGDTPVSTVADNAAGVLEQGSEYLQPWSKKSMFRRMTRTVRQHPVVTVLALLSAIAAAYLSKRSK